MRCVKRDQSLETFEMRVEEEDEGVVIISMPVTDKVKQPFGYLHGVQVSP